jgi:hypothetical protein
MASLGNNTGWAPGGMGNYDPFIRKEMRAGVNVITTFSYYKSVVYYPRIMAYFGRNSILCSSGDSPIRFHRFFRGRDSMKGAWRIAVSYFGGVACPTGLPSRTSRQAMPRYHRSPFWRLGLIHSTPDFVNDKSCKQNRIYWIIVVAARWL